MRRQFTPLAAVSALMMVAAVGCSPQQPFYFSPPRGGDHYVGVAQQIEFPDLDSVTSLDEVNAGRAPLTLDNPKPENYWDLGLEESIRIALANSTVIRNLGGVQFGPTGAVGTPSSLLQAPLQAATMYIPGMSEADPRFGVEAALSAFDAQLSSAVFWENNIIPQNTAGVGAELRPAEYKQHVGNFDTALAKTTASGAQFDVRHNIRYNLDNTPIAAVNPLGTKLWPDDWTVNLQAEGRIPILQGAGAGFNRIAGPGALPGQANGVMLARLRTDQSLTDFEMAVRNLCGDMERAYWNLYYAYRRLDSVVAGRDAALQTWRQAKARFDVGGKGGGAQEEAQARENYLLFKGTVEQAQSNLYKTENILRYMMGLTHSDGRLIRPSEEPTKAKVEFDWYDIHAEALTRSAEIRKQKWSVKQKELELVAAKNYLLPRLDAVGRYGWAGIGDMLLDPSRSLTPRADGTLVPRSGYGSMTSGEFPAWHLGLEFKMPIGFRREMAGVRYAQLNLTRERKVLQEQELELSHQLADAIRDLSQNYNLSQTNYNRWLAAGREVEAVDAAYRVGTTTLDQLLDAQRRKAEAENEYYRTLVDYTLSITNVHLRKGSLLEYDGVFLAEGPWPAKAYFDARRRARHRDASHFINYGFTQPRIVSQGPIEQGAGHLASEGEMPIEAPLPVEPPKPSSGPEVIEPLAPVPMGQAPAMDGARQRSVGSSAGGARGMSGAAARRPGGHAAGRRVVPAAKVGQINDPAGKGYDLAAMNLQGLGKEPSAAPSASVPQLQAPIRAGTQVDAASYQQSTAKAAPTTESTASWKSMNRSDKTNEPVANPTPAPSNPPASGWKSIRR